MAAAFISPSSTTVKRCESDDECEIDAASTVRRIPPPDTRCRSAHPRVVHWRKESFDVYIGRSNSAIRKAHPSQSFRWGNPFIVGRDGTRAEAIRKYRDWLLETIEGQKTFDDARRELPGKTLACWCAPDSCHGDVLLRIAAAAAAANAADDATQSTSTPVQSTAAATAAAAAAAVPTRMTTEMEEVNATLSKRNPHVHDGELLFEPKAHRYTLRKGGAECVSVTTFVDGLFPKFDADAELERMTKNASRWMSGEYAQMTTDQVKAKWDAAGKEAARLGVQMHAQIANHYNSGNSVRFSVEMCHLNAFERQVRLKRGWVPYRVEWAIVEPELLLAGTIDALFRRPNGKFVLVDWKRCKKPIEMTSRYGQKTGCKNTPGELFENCNGGKYSVQLALYAYILRSRYNIDVDQLLLVRLHPDADSYELQDVHVSVEDVGRLVGHRRRQVYDKGN